VNVQLKELSFASKLWELNKLLDWGSLPTLAWLCWGPRSLRESTRGCISAADPDRPGQGIGYHKSPVFTSRPEQDKRIFRKRARKEAVAVRHTRGRRLSQFSSRILPTSRASG
jgi:hypothetical protein